MGPAASAKTPQRIAISGASGLIGSALHKHFQSKGAEVIPLSRLVEEGSPGIRWDIAKGEIEREKLEGVDAIVHLAGESIAGWRWTAEKKRRILESRVKGTRLLCESILQLAQPPRVFLGASAIGYYGDRGIEPLVETSEPGLNFLAKVCVEWEEASECLSKTSVRRVVFRLGPVMAREGGALAAMLPAFKLGLGGVLGSGQQYFSWVTLRDVVGAIDHLLSHDHARGIFNLTSPTPTTNRQMTKALGRVLHRYAVLPVPAWGLRLLLGQMGEEMLLASARALPQRLAELDYTFQDPFFEPAISKLLSD